MDSWLAVPGGITRSRDVVRAVASVLTWIAIGWGAWQGVISHAMLIVLLAVEVVATAAVWLVRRRRRNRGADQEPSMLRGDAASGHRGPERLAFLEIDDPGRRWIQVVHALRQVGVPGLPEGLRSVPFPARLGVPAPLVDGAVAAVLDTGVGCRRVAE